MTEPSTVSELADFFADVSAMTARVMLQVRLSAQGLGPPVETPHPKTVKWARAAYPHLEKCSGVDILMREVADAASKKTAEKWLCQRMPDELYNTGTYTSEDERYKALRRAILRVYAFTESP
jgi:hypothetical protein